MIQVYSIKNDPGEYPAGTHRVYRPLTVTAELVSPLCGDAPHLDALLESAMLYKMPSIMASRNGHRHITRLSPQRSRPMGDAGRIPIPMMRRMIGGWNVACVSSPILSEPLAEWTEYVNRKFDTSYAEWLAPKERIKISVADGSWRSYHLPRRIRQIARVRWFAVGKAKEIRKLLKLIPAIGGETNIGFGRVGAWTVEHIDEDYSWWGPGDVLMRPLPVCEELPEVAGGRKGYGACVSPYWHGSRFTEIVLPC